MLLRRFFLTLFMPFQKGNKLAQEWTLENALPRFEDALEYAETNDECLCLQDAIYYCAIPYTTFYYLADNHDVLNSIKTQIMQSVIRRINRMALKDESPASPSIWRMKQLGERDEQTINTNQTKQEIIVSSKEQKNTIDELFKKLDDE